jgi:hypothetical protein
MVPFFSGSATHWLLLLHSLEVSTNDLHQSLAASFAPSRNKGMTKV